MRAVVAAVTELISEEVRAGRVEQLTELEVERAFRSVLVLADEATARSADKRPGQ